MVHVRDMKRIVILFCAALVLASGPAPSQAATPKATSGNPCDKIRNASQHKACEFKYSAPGDEYFGKMKMSYLGINNTYHDEAIRAGSSTIDSNIINKVSLADDALDAWSRKYPYDPELARSFYLAVKMHQKIYTQDAQDRAWRYMQLEMSRFSQTYFGKQERADMKNGFTEHYYTGAPFCGLVTPAPTETPAPKPGQPKIDLIVPPCVPTPTPLPTPTISPTPHS